ncbi:NAD(P)-dependent oxidoreductase [Terriglobus albidus]|uniref:NAD(P)-dependent oxidoreductase n=1 Tax=Terriglobus albidus TaxID=1592106 RepID=A0A5B9EJH8_9BACT|nr:NAD(P)-dependent oxidoreductase [Terriglobus albidus]QEE30276.1 NAD(P)-dependent oxidoreductase [Terriglobus albidus]
MRIVIIGGSGHIGSYLTPRLATAGHDVLCVSRGVKNPYRPDQAWKQVKHVVLDRDAEEAAGNFGERIAELDGQAVIDLTCYTPASAAQLAEALLGRVEHFLHCGTIWIHGHSCQVPTTEDAPRSPFGEYGVRKVAIEDYLLRLARTKGFPATLLHPGHLVGTGWNPINPQGNFNPAVFTALAQGTTIALPNLGLETVHHVHADDVAQAFQQALTHRSVALGESFHVVSAAALTLRGFAEGMSRWFGQEPKLEFHSWEKWRSLVSEKDALSTWDHIAHSPNCSIEKAKTLLGYQPRYSSFEAVQEAVADMQRRGVIEGN